MHDRSLQSGAHDNSAEWYISLGQWIEAVPDAVVVSNSRGIIVLCNREIESLLGYSTNELVNESIDLLVPERFRADHIRKRSSYYDAPESRRVGEARPLFIRRKDGAEIAVEITLSSVDSGGNILVVSMIRDVSERTRFEAALEQRTRQLEQSNLELQQFVYAASHDLQEPLRIITGYAKLLDRRYREYFQADGCEFIEFIVDGTARMQELINDLMEFSRIGTRAKPSVPVRLADAVEQVISGLRPAIEESDATISTDEGRMSVIADEAQLVQVLRNLISNALKFRRREPPVVTVSWLQQGDQVIVSVADNGIGIESRHYVRIFQLFQKLHTKREYPGTGIGLAICKRIVERHGGRIWVTSDPGKGATFQFSLPVVS